MIVSRFYEAKYSDYEFASIAYDLLDKEELYAWLYRGKIDHKMIYRLQIMSQHPSVNDLNNSQYSTYEDAINTIQAVIDKINKLAAFS